jgi:predicted NBD/HSP70 family sugar kinase
MQREFSPTPSLTGQGISNLKAHNLRALLLTLLQQEGVSRVSLARLTGLSTTTVTNLVSELIQQGIVTEEGRVPNARSGAGRPPTLLKLVPFARYSVGIHIGVDTLFVGVTDLFGKVQAESYIPHHPHADPSEILDRASSLVKQIVAKLGLLEDKLVGVGVGASGLVDIETGVNVLAPNLGWQNIPIHDILAERLDYPVFVDNNVRAMALAESMFGDGRGVNTMAFVYSRVGVGAGFVVNDQVYRGSGAGAGEIGHITMIPAGGAPCRCGNTGCLETLVSEGTIVRQAQTLASRSPQGILAKELAQLPGGLPETRWGLANDESNRLPPAPSEEITARIFSAARAGDPEVLAMLDQSAFYMGTALANVVNLINPDMIILGGLFAAGADLMLSRIEETMRRRAFAGLGDDIDLRVTSFGSKPGVVGAAALALDTFFYRQEGVAV